MVGLCAFHTCAARSGHVGGPGESKGACFVCYLSQRDGETKKQKEGTEHPSSKILGKELLQHMGAEKWGAGEEASKEGLSGSRCLRSANEELCRA